MFKALSRNLKNGLVGLVLCGLPINLLNGCASQEALDRYNRGEITFDQYESAKQQDQFLKQSLALSLLGGGLAGYGAQKGKIGGVYLGEAISNHGAAMAGKSNVNQTVNVKNPPENSQLLKQNGDTREYLTKQKERNYFIAEDGSIEGDAVSRKKHSSLGWFTLAICNYCRDFNENGILDFPEDYVGVKNNFLLNEKITITFGITKKEEYSLECILLDKNGDSIDTVEAKKCATQPYGITNFYNSRGARMSLPIGDYAAIFYSDDEFLGKIEFHIIKDNGVNNAK